MSIELLNGNSYELIKQLPDKSVDLVVTDPPYDFMTKHKSENYGGGGAFGTLGRAYHGELQNNNIINGIDIRVMLEELRRVMKKINIYIWCNKEQIYEYLTYFKEYNMELLTWHKSNPIPTCNNKYLSDTEYLLFFRENGVKIYGTYETKGKYYVTPTNKADKDKYNHPTIKPLNIIENLVLNSSTEGQTVLDPFMGSGTTGVACKIHNRNFIGMEIDKTFYKTAEERITNTDIKTTLSQSSLFD